MFRSLRLVSFLSFAALAALSTACRDTGSGDDTNIDAPMGPDSAQGGLTIQEIHAEAMVPGTPVELKGKVVVAIDNFGAKKGNFWVAEEGGGEFSGVLVFNAPVDQVALLAVGDKVDISGAEKSEFALATDTSGRTTTELVPVSGGAMTVTKVGTGTPPAAHAIDALAIGQMAPAARDAELEKWEGVLITVTNVSALSNARQIGSSAQDDCTFRDFQVTGAISIDSSLAAIPANLPMTMECPATMETNLVNSGDCLASVTGIGDYFFSYKILPRMTADIATGGTGCPAAENTATTCMDTIDNDGNGFADCADRNCQALPQCISDTTVENIQTGAVPTNAAVTLNDVVVTAIGFNKKNLWVADHAAAAINQGVYVFRGSSAAELDVNIHVGSHVTISGGKVVEFGTAPDTITEISAVVSGTPPTVALVAGSPTETVTPIANAPIATLVSRTTGEPYEGVLVELRNVKITGPIESMIVPPATVATFQRPLAIGATAFEADDDIYRMTSEPDATCYASIVGVWHYNTFSDTNNWVFLPRHILPGDETAGSSCP